MSFHPPLACIHRCTVRTCLRLPVPLLIDPGDLGDLVAEADRLDRGQGAPVRSGNLVRICRASGSLLDARADTDASTGSKADADIDRRRWRRGKVLRQRCIV